MQLIMDNMLKTSDSIYKLMTGMKSEEFADKMVNDTAFRARYDKIETNFLAQMDSVSHCIKDWCSEPNMQVIITITTIISILRLMITGFIIRSHPEAVQLATDRTGR